MHATDRPTSLFQHLTRPEWGLAILAWQRGDKRGFQFEDGRLRIFKTGASAFLRRVDRPVDETARVTAELGKAIGRERAAKRIGADHVITLDDRLAYFRRVFPKGFQGVNWARKHRGIDAKTPLKRHRRPLVQRASDLLSPDRLRAHLEGGLANVIVDHLVAITGATDLVGTAAVRGLAPLPHDTAAPLVRALCDLLTDDSDLVTAFDAWVGALTRVLGRVPTWELATSFPALARPDRFVAIKRSTFTCAAAWLAPNLLLEDRPTGVTYHRLLDMTTLLLAKLGEAGFRPRDRLDVYDFLQVTSSAKARAEITAATTGELAVTDTPSTASVGA